MSRTRAPAPSDHRVLVAVLIVVSMLNPLSINIIVPALPSVMATLGGDIGTVQLVLTLYLAATAVAQLFAGPLSDRFGRRPVILIGLAVYLAASLLCAIASSLPMLLLARALQGAGGSTAFALCRAVVRDRYDRNRAASMIGYITMGFAVGPMVGPAVGGMIDDHFGWRPIFAFTVGLGILATLAALLRLPETRRLGEGVVPTGFLANIAALLRVRAFWSYALTMAFGAGVYFAFLGGTPFIATEMLGMSGTRYGLYFLCVSGGYMIGNFFTGRYAPRFGLNRFITIGNLIALAAVAGMVVAFGLGAVTPLTLFAPVYLVAFANGLSLPCAVTGAVSVRPDLAGTASGLAGALQVGAGAIATVIAGAVLETLHSPFVLSLVMLAIAALALIAGNAARRDPA
jgi:DHA1 family bicyclomycin/chloramphenicol resistance-like MFS transporter